jgi:hypothetical protein
VCGGHGRVLRVSSVKVAAQTAHHGRDHIAWGELTARRIFHQPDSLDTEYAREPHVRRMPLARKQFRPVQTECLDADYYLTCQRYRNRSLLDLENLGSARLMDDRRFHHRRTHARGGLVVEKQ